MFKKYNRIDTDSIHATIQLKNKEIEKVIEMLDITIYDLKFLRYFKTHIQDQIDDLIDNFYNSISMDDSLVKIINENSSVDKLKLTLRSHVLEMFSGVIDSNYIERRKRIALVHLKIGLSSNAYIASFTSILKDAVKLINENIVNNEDKLLVTQAVIKIISLEKQLTLQAYDKLSEKQQQEAQESKNKLSSVIVDSSSSLAAVSEQTTASYQQIKEQVHNILNFAMKSKQVAENMENKANEGKSSIQRQSVNMQEIVQTVSTIEQEMQGMKNINKQIEDIVFTINEISNQTKLISFNAQIEASRLGEQGRGFNIIAQEIRSLSDITADSIKLANKLLLSIHEETDNLKDAIGAVANSVSGGVINLQNTEERFIEIVSFTQENKEQSSLIKNEIKDLEEVMGELSEALTSVAVNADALSSISHELLQ